MIVPIFVTAGMAVASFALCLVALHWFERRYGNTPRPTGLTPEWFRLWALRLAGLWLVFWLLAPAMAQTPPIPAIAETNARQILLGAQRLESVESRIASIESLRLDARLALLEDMRDDVNAMQSWMLGILGGVVVIVLVQILGLVQRPRA